MKKDFITYGPMSLRVRDLQVSTDFWENVIGLHVLDASESKVSLGIGEKTMIVLHSGAKMPFMNGYSGLYHVAVHVPQESDLALILKRLIELRWPTSPTDHIMSKAIYLQDPDGITIEITLETPERFDRYNMDQGNFEVIDSQGNVRGATEPLDIYEVLSTLEETDINTKLPENAFIGHVHVYVSDLKESYDFYKKLGFIDNLLSEEIGFADLSAGGIFKHRMAMNTWQSKGKGQADPDSAGMNSFTIEYASEEMLQKVLRSFDDVQEFEGKYRLIDPSGNVIFLTRRASF